MIELTCSTSLLEGLRVAITKTSMVLCDNLSTTQLAANPVLHAKIKHIKLDLYLVREKFL